MDELVGVGPLSKAVGMHPNWLRELADRGEIPSIRTKGGQRRFNVTAVQIALAERNKATLSKQGASPQISDPQNRWEREFDLSGLSEDVVFREIVRDLHLNMSENCADTIPYAFTEMLNNAIEHSMGTRVLVTFVQTDSEWSFKIQDNGQGTFHNIMSTFHLSSNLEAIAELSKGKRTTAAKGHSGEGIFFTSKAVDLFWIQSNGLIWTVNNLVDDFAVGESSTTPGTTVECTLARNTARTLGELFGRFSKDHNFTRSRPTVKLFETGMMFVSRSEAKRLLVGLEKFTEVELDFAQVKSVGQGFVDEIFRVWALDNPGTHFYTVNMNPAVEFMVLRGLPKID